MSDIVAHARQIDLAKIAERIRTRMKRTLEDIVAIGQDLIEAKAYVEHGNFEQWLQAEFEMNERTAQRFMQVADRFGGKSDNLSFLKPSILYLLAAPSTPESVVEKVTSGETPANTAAVKEEIARAKAEAEAARKQAAKFQAMMEGAQEATEELEQGYEERIKALTRTIDALKSEQGQTKPDPKQAKKIADLEKQIAKLEAERDAAGQLAKDLQARADYNTPEAQARLHWHSNASTASTMLKEVIAYLPSQEAIATFGDAELRRLDDIERYAQQVITVLHDIRTGPTIVDAQ